MTEKLVLKGDNCGSGFTPSMALILPTDMAALSFASIHYPHSPPSTRAACHRRGSATSRTRWPVATSPRGPVPWWLPERSAATWRSTGKAKPQELLPGLVHPDCTCYPAGTNRYRADFLPSALNTSSGWWWEKISNLSENGFCLIKCFQQTWICEILSESCCQHPRLLKTFVFTPGQFDMNFTSGQATAQCVIVNTKLPPTALHPPP